jgi:hypothetical protein
MRAGDPTVQAWTGQGDWGDGYLVNLAILPAEPAG